jgi:hypothetical protein
LVDQTYLSTSLGAGENFRDHQDACGRTFPIIKTNAMETLYENTIHSIQEPCVEIMDDIEVRCPIDGSPMETGRGVLFCLKCNYEKIVWL